MPNQLISLQEAIAMTTLYRSRKDNILVEEFRGLDILAMSETFDRAAFDTVLSQQGCTSLRIYFGMSTDLKIHPLVVGVNDNNEDIIPPQVDASLIIEDGLRCPPVCPVNSPLNQ